MKKGVHYEERTGWAWWAHLGFSIICLAAVFPLAELAQGKIWGQGDAMPLAGAIFCLSLGFGIPVAIYLFLGEIRVRVRGDGVEAAWGYSEMIRKWIPFGEIDSLEAVTYSPLREFGGWGIRAGRGGKTAWTTQGNRALCFFLRGRGQFWLGSKHPERLQSWVRSVGGRRMGTGRSETDVESGGSTGVRDD